MGSSVSLGGARTRTTPPRTRPHFAALASAARQLAGGHQRIRTNPSHDDRAVLTAPSPTPRESGDGFIRFVGRGPHQNDPPSNPPPLRSFSQRSQTVSGRAPTNKDEPIARRPRRPHRAVPHAEGVGRWVHPFRWEGPAPERPPLEPAPTSQL